VPSPASLVEKMLDMAGVGAGDFVMDLGSGDGRVVIAAAKRGARALGVEYTPELVTLSRRNAADAGVSERASFVQGDMFEGRPVAGDGARALPAAREPAEAHGEVRRAPGGNAHRQQRLPDPGLGRGGGRHRGRLRRVVHGLPVQSSPRGSPGAGSSAAASSFSSRNSRTCAGRSSRAARRAASRARCAATASAC